MTGSRITEPLSPSEDHDFRAVSIVQDEAGLTVTWSNGASGRFLYFWLRENCPEDANSLTGQRLLNLGDIPDDIRPTHVGLVDGSVCLNWPDGRTSVHDPGRVDGVVAEPRPPQTRACAIDALGSSHGSFRSGGIDGPRDPGWWQGEVMEDGIEPFPYDLPVAVAPAKPAPPASDDSLPEPGELFAIACQTVVGAVAPDDTDQVPVLDPKRLMAVLLAPFPDRLDGPRKAHSGREPPHDPTSLPRLAPQVGEAEEVELVLCVMSTATPGPEVHELRLGRVKPEPVPLKTLSQNGQHTLAVPAVLEGDDKVIGKAHEPTGSHARLHGLRHPHVQHMVQEDVG